MSQRVPPSVPIEYPNSDGRPMAENDVQRAAIMYAIAAMSHESSGAPGFRRGDRS